VPLRLPRLRRRLERGLRLLPGPLPDSLEEIEFVLIDRVTMARVHGDFLGDPTETDVITFPYGEILICPAVARDQASRHGLAVEDEVLLYGLHGLLHLTGYDDLDPGPRRKMKAAQNRLLAKVIEADEAASGRPRRGKADGR
jgi:probable rRNA maturation factor